MNARGNKGDEYYPIRWKLADFVENIIILHRTRAALVLAALGILLIFIGSLVIGWRPWDSSDETTSPAQAEVAQDEDPDEITQDEAIGIASSDNATATTSDGTQRPRATEEQLRFTSSGTVIELGPTVMALTGGFTADAGADAALARASELFPTREVFDAQVLGETFLETQDLTIRIVEPGLFAEGTAELNPAFTPLLSDIANVILSSGELTVDVVGHTAGVPRSENQAQAIADALIAAGVAGNTISVSGVGNSAPLPGVASRIEFIIR